MDRSSRPSPTRSPFRPPPTSVSIIRVGGPAYDDATMSKPCARTGTLNPRLLTWRGHCRVLRDERSGGILLPPTMMVCGWPRSSRSGTTLQTGGTMDSRWLSVKGSAACWPDFLIVAGCAEQHDGAATSAAAPNGRACRSRRATSAPGTRSPASRSAFSAAARRRRRPTRCATTAQIDVLNRCRKDALDGPEKSAHGRARVVDRATNARLEVSFFRPFWGDYWIIDLADDYSYAVVGHPGRDYLWILARKPSKSRRAGKRGSRPRVAVQSATRTRHHPVASAAIVRRAIQRHPITASMGTHTAGLCFVA